jgi:hypothetical protein
LWYVFVLFHIIVRGARRHGFRREVRARSWWSEAKWRAGRDIHFCDDESCVSSHSNARKSINRPRNEFVFMQSSVRCRVRFTHSIKPNLAQHVGWFCTCIVLVAGGFVNAQTQRLAQLLAITMHLSGSLCALIHTVVVSNALLAPGAHKKGAGGLIKCYWNSSLLNVVAPMAYLKVVWCVMRLEFI